MFDIGKKRDVSKPARKRKDNETPAAGTTPAKREKDETSSLEQFQKRGYDSGFVFHEE